METALPEIDDQWDFTDPALSEARFRALLTTASALGATDYATEARTQIARAQGLQRRFAAAHATLDAALAQLPEQPSRARVRYLLERGRVYNSSRKLAEARPLFHGAWEQARALSEDALAVDAAHMLAIIAPDEEKMTWNRAALDLALASAQPRARHWQGSLYNNIGWAQFDAGHYPDALAMFAESLRFEEASGSIQHARSARWSIGRVKRALGAIEEALAMQHALLQETKQGAEPDGFVYEELGECLLALGRGGEARPFFVKAYALLAPDPWLTEQEPARMERLKHLAASADANPPAIDHPR